jgi:hypothetical protein
MSLCSLRVGLMRLAALQHLTVQQSSERLGGVLDDFTDVVAVLRCTESGKKQIQVSALHAVGSAQNVVWWYAATK